MVRLSSSSEMRRMPGYLHLDSELVLPAGLVPIDYEGLRFARPA